MQVNTSNLTRNLKDATMPRSTLHRHVDTENYMRVPKAVASCLKTNIHESEQRKIMNYYFPRSGLGREIKKITLFCVGNLDLLNTKKATM